jgi:hypothetical protein
LEKENNPKVNDPSDFSDRLELFFGHAADAVARVYARLRGSEHNSELQLTGTLKGPSCRYAKTLQATFSLADRGPGNSLLAETIIPEPCFWTPEMPQLYDAEVQLRRRGEILAHASRIFAIRRLGARGRKLLFDGKGWVLRAVSRDEAPAAELSQWREADAAMLVRDPDEKLCEEASRVGVLLVADLDRPKPETLSPCGRGQVEGADVEWARNKTLRLSRWPAVGMVVSTGGAAFDPGDLNHNLLLAQRFRPEHPVAPAAWADVVVCEMADADNWAARTADCKLPTIAARLADKQIGVAGGRTLCDRLQRDLAGRGEIAGYIV